MSSFKIFVYPCNVTGCRWIDDPWLTCWVFSWVASFVISKFDKGDLVHSRMDSFVTTVRFDVTLFVTVIACPCIFFWLYYLLSLLLVIVRPDIPPRRPYSEASRLFIFSRYLPRPPLLDWIRFVVAPAALVAACSIFLSFFQLLLDSVDYYCQDVLIFLVLLASRASASSWSLNCETTCSHRYLDWFDQRFIFRLYTLHYCIDPIRFTWCFIYIS